jgi:pyruvate ferredoxin oxidoreductase alpha subunit
VQPYRCADAETVVVALGSVLGSVQDVVDARRDRGELVGALGITCFRPWPREAVRTALARARRVVVLEKAFAVGVGGIVAQDVRVALDGVPVDVREVVAGLGGRPVTSASLHRLLAGAGALERLTFLDLNRELVS